MMMMMIIIIIIIITITIIGQQKKPSAGRRSMSCCDSRYVYPLGPHGYAAPMLGTTPVKVLKCSATYRSWTAETSLIFLGFIHSCLTTLFVRLYTDVSESTERAVKLSVCCPILCKACRHVGPSSIPRPVHV